MSEEIQDFEKEQKTLIKDEKEKKLNKRFLGWSSFLHYPEGSSKILPSKVD